IASHSIHTVTWTALSSPRYYMSLFMLPPIEVYWNMTLAVVQLSTPHKRRSVSHAQLMHDKGRSLEEFKRRLWLQELLDKVHTADSVRAPPPQSRNNANGGHITFSGNALRPPKPPGGTKNLPLSFRLGGEGGNLPQETNKSVAYKDQPLKVATKRKKKVKGERGRRRESEKRRRRATQPLSRHGRHIRSHRGL
ncbi:unnamed protein product, partial [Coregonus sp. 'balchen']